jgi:hypothetical protein
MEPAKKPRDTIDALYLTILSRYPTASEVSALTAYRQEVPEKRRLAMDIAWALINTAEFQCRH